jgi:hypothetical protein
MRVTLAFDAAWGGTGWCLATEQGPVAVGHVKLSGRAWRWPALLAWLDAVIAPELVDGELLRGDADPPIRLVIEEPPAVYSGAERWAKAKQGHLPGAKPPPAGNQAATCFGLGRLAGALELWWVKEHPEKGYPWLVEPREWRTWMKVGGTGRIARKRAAVDTVKLSGWGHHLVPFPWDPDPDKAGGALGDVAEAILLAVGASRNASLAPVGPSLPARPPKPTVRPVAR